MKKIMKLKNIVKNRLVVVKVGNDDRPAGPKDIKDMKKKIKKALKKNRILVTHHAVEFEII
jgi:hypothetical protein